MTSLPGGIRQTTTCGGTRIYTLEVLAYPGLPVHSFVLLRDSPQGADSLQGAAQCILVDVGSEDPQCAHQLAEGLDALGVALGRRLRPDAIVLTHEHRDHVGGLPLLPSRYHAPVTAHAVAARAIRDPLGAHAQAKRAQEKSVRWLGVPDSVSAQMVARARPLLAAGVPVETELTDGGLADGELDGWIRAVHVPGHAAGQVMLRVDDVLLTADHLLAQNLPPLWPKHAHPGLGLRNYLDSLQKVQDEEGVTLSLPSHGPPIEDTRKRVGDLVGRIQSKAEKVAGQVARLPGATAFELTQALYPSVPQIKSHLLLGQVAALLEVLCLDGRVVEESHPDGAARWWAGSESQVISSAFPQRSN